MSALCVILLGFMARNKKQPNRKRKAKKKQQNEEQKVKECRCCMTYFYILS